ncbi:MAG: T9SS type A sorting domain-containing protein [Bacteroidota bacterium]
MRNIFLFVGFFQFGFFSIAQTTPNGVLASSGDEVILAQVQMVWILGDTFVGSLENSSIRLSQGLAYASVDLTTSAHRISLPGLKVYPNPGSETIWIEGVPYEGAWTLKLFSPQGKMLLTVSLHSFSNNEISLHKLPTGTYLLHIENQNGQHLPFRLLKL